MSKGNTKSMNGPGVGTTNNQHESASDNDEYIVHQEGNEEIHITGKARKQLKWPLLSMAAS